MRRTLSTLAPALGVALAMTLAPSSRADVFDTTLASPNSDPTTLSWYNGTGNQGVQGGWTVNTENGIEIGLRAKYRQGAVIDSSSNVYNVLPGLQNPTHALWNYEWSIDLQPNGVGTGTLNQITARITITDLAPGGGTISYNPLDPALGDCAFGPGASTSGCTGAHIPPVLGSDWGAQNSENPMFAGLFPSTYDPNATDSYDITLTVRSGDRLLDSAQIEINATPEPTSVILLGSLALGLVFLGRRRFAAKSVM